MKSFMPIPKRLLPHTIGVRVPDGRGGFADAVEVRNVALQLTQSACGDDHRSADAGSGIVFIDAMNSEPCIEVPAGSRIDFEGSSYYVTESTALETVQGQIHHWELKVK